MMEFASSPHARRHVPAVAMGVQTRKDSRERSVTQALESGKDPPRQHADRVGDIGVIFSDTFYRMGIRQFPFYVQSQMAREWFDLRNIVCIRRMEYY